MKIIRQIKAHITCMDNESVCEHCDKIMTKDRLTTVWIGDEGFSVCRECSPSFSLRALAKLIACQANGDNKPEVKHEDH
jgi:ribosomal protein L37AE/L43A